MLPAVFLSLSRAALTLQILGSVGSFQQINFPPANTPPGDDCVDNLVMLLQADVSLSRNMLLFLIQYYYGKLMFPARCESTCGRVSGLMWTD